MTPKVPKARSVLLALDLLHVDHDNYQRQQLDPHVAKIVREWNEDLLTSPTIIHRVDGTYWIADGQQRIAAARQLGYTHLEVKLLHARDLKHEAWLFVQLNIGPRRLGAQPAYKADLKWGEQIATATEEILQEFGLTGRPGRHTGTAQEVSAVRTLREAWGAAANRPGVVLDDASLAYGKTVLRWVLAAGEPMLQKGERACDVFQKANLGTLIWIRRNALQVPDIEVVQDVLYQTTSQYIKEIASGIGSSGGNARGMWGIRLAAWLNERATSHTVRLPDATWKRLQGE